MLGTVSDFSLRESHCSVCVVRPTAPAPEGEGKARSTRYLFSTDGSHAAALAFCVLLHQ